MVRLWLGQLVSPMHILIGHMTSLQLAHKVTNHAFIVYYMPCATSKKKLLHIAQYVLILLQAALHISEGCFSMASMRMNNTVFLILHL